ncbi:MAG: SIR2 family protein [Bacteroidota bacterium]
MSDTDAKRQNRSMSEEDWNEILASLEREACILVLGPGAIIGKEGENLHDKLCSLLEEYLEVNVEENPEKLFSLGNQITQKRGWRKTLSDLTRTAYSQDNPHEVYSKLSCIPLPLIISTSPDMLIHTAFDQQGIGHQFAHYNYKKNPELETAPTKEMPLIYNLFGRLDDEDSLVLTHDSLFDFIFSILSSKPLPLPLKEKIVDAYNLIFLGFDFESWYMKILLRLFKSHKKEISYAHAWRVDNLKLDTREFFASNFKLDFVDANVIDFVNELHERCQKDGILREPEADAGQLTPFQQVSNLLKKSEVEEAIDFLDNYSQEIEDNDLFTEVVLLSRRYNGLISNQNKGTIAKDDFDLELNKIVNALLGIAENLES